MTLTCWKDVAAYLHKGVRTVQRWELEGLPVRRLSSHRYGIVLAFTEELDGWLNARHGSEHRLKIADDNELIARCRSLIETSKRLRLESAELRDCSRNLRLLRSVSSQAMREETVALHTFASAWREQQ